MRPGAIAINLGLIFGIVFQSAGQSYVGAAGMVNAGYLAMPVLSSSLNSLPGNSIHFRGGYMLFGGEINYRYERLVGVGSAYIGVKEGKYFGSQLIEPLMWKTHGGVGWIVYQGHSIFVYPVIGGGAIQSSLIYHTRSESQTHSQRTAPSMDISLHFDWVLNDDPHSEDFYNTAMISVRFGYTRSLSLSELQGWAVTVSAGGLAFLKHKPSRTK
jgi:hypothetical protein